MDSIWFQIAISQDVTHVYQLNIVSLRLLKANNAWNGSIDCLNIRIVLVVDNRCKFGNE